ncbi:MAG TPA: hypothetical protein VN493_27815 [Thermoanaerobaculia bacterium]|nr:hypothetical protein [Thermoanaerobaculia bacterium]
MEGIGSPASIQLLQRETSQQEGSGLSAATRFLATFISLAIYAGILVWILSKTEYGQKHLSPVALGLIFVLIIAISAVIAAQRWLAGSTAQRRIGFVIFGVIPTVLLSVGTVILLPEHHQVAGLRVIFLAVVCSLPAIMYYLFMSTKKYSLLNDFIINLDRLGLRDPGRLPKGLVPNGLGRESAEERKSRIYTYIQKFEAVYGAIPTDLGGLVLDPTNTNQRTIDPRMSKTDASGFAAIFTLDTTVPVVLTTVLITLGWLITLPPYYRGEPEQLSTWMAFLPVETPVHFAFIGAYFFSLQMLFRRYVRRDLRSSAYVSVSLRIILSLIGTWVVMAAATMNPLSNTRPEVLMVVGFVIGVFPRVVWRVLQAAVKRGTGAVLLLPSLQAQLPLSDLDGLTVWHEARLEEEDIENIPNMATADLIDLMINTRFPPDRLIDWMDQSILYTHLGPERKKNGKEPTRRDLLRAHGIRTASALVEVYARCESEKDREDFDKILPVGEGRSLIRSLVNAVATSPNLKLIQIWRGLDATTSRVPEQPPSPALPGELRVP